MTTKVLYHAWCPDGFTAAWIASKSLPKDTSYVPVKYGDPPPLFNATDEVFIVDFSYKRADTQRIHDSVSRLMVLDHHQTAEHELVGLPYCTFDMDRSGAMLAYDYFQPSGECRDIVRYVQDRDLWRWELPFSKQVNAWLYSYEQTFANWDYAARIIADSPSMLIPRVGGEALLRMNERSVQIGAKIDGYVVLDGNRAPLVPFSPNVSEVLERVCEENPDAPFAVAWKLDITTMMVRLSLRTKRDDVDVSEAARLYGGGGHRAAAGCSMRFNDFQDRLV